MAAVARYTPRYPGSARLLYPEEDGALSKAAVRLWNALARRGALSSALAFSPSRLAPEIEMSRSGIFAALRELTMGHYIERGRSGRLTSARCVTPRKGGYPQ